MMMYGFQIVGFGFSEMFNYARIVSLHFCSHSIDTTKAILVGLELMCMVQAF